MRAAELPSLAGSSPRADLHEERGQRAGVTMAGGSLVLWGRSHHERVCVGEGVALTQASGCDLGGQPRGRGTASAPGWG